MGVESVACWCACGCGAFTGACLPVLVWVCVLPVEVRVCQRAHRKVCERTEYVCVCVLHALWQVCAWPLSLFGRGHPVVVEAWGQLAPRGC